MLRENKKLKELWNRYLFTHPPPQTCSTTMKLLVIMDIIGLGLLGGICFSLDRTIAMFAFLQAGFALWGLFILLNSSNFIFPSINSPDRSVNLIWSRYLDMSFYFLTFIFIFGKLLNLLNFQGFHSLINIEWIYFIYALLVAISEEIFFRGALFQQIFLIISRKSFPQKTTFHVLNWLVIFILPAFLWTCLHINYYNNILQLVYIFLTGILFAILYVYKKQIGWLILLHFISNLIANLLLFF